MSLFTGPYSTVIKYGLVAAFLAAAYGFVYHQGFKSATANCEAGKLAAIQKYQTEYQKAVERANVLAQKLATRESQVVYRTKEVIKHVPQVTTGKSCLSADAVRLLNNRDTTVSEAPGKPAPESPPDAPVTDTDTAYWIADAISRYEIAAARLNALVDYFEKGE